jgi:hypothetical protein
MAAVRYLKNRMNSYHLNAKNKREERDAIKHILIANKYDASIVDTTPKIRNKKENEGKIWAKFTYTGKETKSITKLFKNSIVKISYTTRNTIARLLTEKSKPEESKFEGSGVYQHTCPDCNMKYIGQTADPSVQDFQNTLKILNTPPKNHVLHSICWSRVMLLDR